MFCKPEVGSQLFILTFSLTESEVMCQWRNSSSRWPNE